MKRNKWLVCLIALTMLLAFAFAPEASAADDWKSAYSSLLKQGVGAKRAIGLADITGDGSPELIVVTTGTVTGIAVYTMDGGALAPIPVQMSALPLTGVKSVGMVMRADGAKNACVTLTIKAVEGKKTTTAQVGLAKGGANQITTAYYQHTLKNKSKTTYYANGVQTTKAKYNSAKKAYEKAYKKVGTVYVRTIAAKDSAATVQTRLNQASKKYLSFANVGKITLSKTKLTVTAGKTASLSAKKSPSTAIYDTISWSSDKPNIAIVSGTGKVTGVAAGTAKITARSLSGKSKTCTVTVKGPNPTGVTIGEKTVMIDKNATKTLTASVAPATASQALTWSSSNKNVATVTNAGVVTGVGSGTAVLTAKTGNGKKTTCNIVVTDGPAVIIDISQHNYSTKMDWKKISENVQLLILRCGVTRTDTNPIGVGKDDKFEYYAKQCKTYGIPFGVYYYGKCSDEATAIEEAMMTWRMASPHNPLFYVYDCEESRLNKQLIETYMRTLQSLGAKKTGYYIAHHLYSTYKLDTSLVDFVWIPRYGSNTGAVDALPSHACDLHQYTSLGRVPGFPYYVDISQLTGSKSLSWFLTP